MELFSQLSTVDAVTLGMSALGLFGGVVSTVITMNAKYYEDQRQLRMTVGDLTQKLLVLRGEDELLNVKALRGEERSEEFALAHANNLRTQNALARLMVDALDLLKRSASSVEYEILATTLTTNGDRSADKYWRLAMGRAREIADRRATLVQYAYALVRFGREVEGEARFEEAMGMAIGDPVQEGYITETRGRALHAIRKAQEARAAFDKAQACYLRIPDEGTRDLCVNALKSARATVGL